MEKILIIEMGMGADLHGQDVTKAAVRAVEDAIRHNSLPGLRHLLPDGDLKHLKVNIRLAVPADADQLDVEKVKAVLPYGTKTVEIVPGGMLTPHGIFLPDRQDKNDLIYIVNAAIEAGY